MSVTKSLSWSDFSGRKGVAFDLHTGGDRYDFILENAHQSGGGARSGGAFRLTFRGPYEPVLDQGTYRMSAPGLDSDIFLVPVSREESGTLYEAIFN